MTTGISLHDRHGRVEQDEVGAFLLGLLDAFLTIDGGEDFDIEGFEGLGHDHVHHARIIDAEDLLGHNVNQASSLAGLSIVL
jgi:hypothetical protein